MSLGSKFDINEDVVIKQHAILFAINVSINIDNSLGNMEVI